MNPEARLSAWTQATARQLADVDEVVHVFRLVWPAAEIEVRLTPPGVVVGLRLDALTHQIMLGPEFVAEGAGLRLVRELFKGRVPEALAHASQPRTLTLAGKATTAGRN